MSQRHHLVPRFHLDRWKVTGKGLIAIRRSTEEVHTRNAKSVAVESDAYAIEVRNQGKNYIVEKMRSRVESEQRWRCATCLSPGRGRTRTASAGRL